MEPPTKKVKMDEGENLKVEAVEESEGQKGRERSTDLKAGTKHEGEKSTDLSNPSGSRDSQNAEDHRCHYLNPYKHKRCGLQVRKGMKYCFAHIKLMEPDAEEAEKQMFRLNRKGEKVGRVPCPVDPSHTVWENRLVSHIKKCNASKKMRAQEERQRTCDWFDLNCNVKEEEQGDMRLGDEDVDYEEYKQFISRTLERYDEYFGDKPEIPLDVTMYKEGLSERFQEVTNRKHLKQQSSLIGQLEKNGLLGRSNLYVEFGCGRAEFSRYLNRVLDAHDFGSDQENGAKCRFLMIDRDSPRMKMDPKMVEDVKTSARPAPEVHRLKVDIKDLVLDSALNAFAGAHSSPVVGISKHLCGVATDLTLRCLANAVSSDAKFIFKGFLVAMCCRHCCYYPWLLPESKDFLKEHFGIDQSNFKYLRKMCPWATSWTGRTEDGDGTEHFTGMTFEQRQEVGLKMRRILDTSRCVAMEKRGLKVRLVRYVGRDVTYENNCMVVTQ